MFSKVAILATISLALSVAAAPGGGNEYKCNTGDAYCCNTTQQAQTITDTKILAVLGGSAQGLTGLAGLTCTPITAIGAGSGASCSQQPVCCEKNHMNGLVAVGCTPINVSA